MRAIALVKDRKDLQAWVKKHDAYLKNRDEAANKVRDERKKLWSELHAVLLKSGDVPKDSTPDSVRLGFDDKFEVLKVGDPSETMTLESISSLVEALGRKK